MTLSELKSLMEQKGLSAYNLAEISGMPEKSIQKYLNGEAAIPDYFCDLLNENLLTPPSALDYIREPLPEYNTKGKYTLDDYYAIPDERRVELIDGVFYEMLTPSYAHQCFIREICAKIDRYIRDNRGNCELLVSPLDIQLDCDNYTMVQPDIMILCDQKKITNRCIIGAPDFIIEILSPSTRKKDMTIKLAKYRKAGVREYWMIDIEKESIIVYFFEESEMPTIYGPQDEIPVHIYEGKLTIRLEEAFRKIRDILG